MKNGSMMAIYKLKDYNTKNGKMYVATLVEKHYNAQIPHKNKFEYAFYGNVLFFTDKELHKAEFNIDIPDQEVKLKDGTTFPKKISKLDFRRIGNLGANCLIRVNDFEVYNATCWHNGEQVLNNFNGSPLIQTTFVIHDFDILNVLPKYDYKKTADYKKKLAEKKAEEEKSIDNTITDFNDDLALADNTADNDDIVVDDEFM